MPTHLRPDGPREQSPPAARPRLRIVGHRGEAQRPGEQLILPLRWCSLAEGDREEPAATLAIHDEPVCSAKVSIPPVNSALALLVRHWPAGEHAHSGPCIRIPAPEGFEACILISRETSGAVVALPGA